MAPEVKARASLDSKGFNAGLGRMKGSVGKFGKIVKKIGPLVAAAFSIIAIKRFLSAVKTAGSLFEDLTVQFKVLLGSQEKAAAHMKDLAKFSAKTPFQIADIANASQQLLNFSEGALGGIDSLTLFGDAAAAVGEKDLPQLSFWVGRLYANLSAGRPIIDSVNALARMKIVAPSVMKSMIELSEAGKTGGEVWRVFTDDLKRFEGGMVQLSGTVSGKTSTMKDNWILALAEMGDAMRPMTMATLEWLTKLANGFSQFVRATGAWWKGADWGDAWVDAGKEVADNLEKNRHKFTKDVGDMGEAGLATSKKIKQISKAIKEIDITQIEKAGGFFGGARKSSFGLDRKIAEAQKKLDQDKRNNEKKLINSEAASAVKAGPLSLSAAKSSRVKPVDQPGIVAAQSKRDLANMDSKLGRIAAATESLGGKLDKIASNTKDGGLG